MLRINSFKMGPCIQDSGVRHMVAKKDMEFKYGLMVQNMKGNGCKVKQTDMDDLSLQMEMSMKENGLMTKLMDMVFILMQMGQSILELGLMISKKEKGLRPGQIAPLMMESIKTGKSMDLVNSYGLMVRVMKECGRTTRCTGMESSAGKMEECMKANM
mmetsp:Transcript_29494/g.21948  ORF Transcript_29494/g.21948 Transcript_29494/m.21948 type:complete len:158 (-) Transcript_29494:219-692(-)